jgi:hypothetical protein
MRVTITNASDAPRKMGRGLLYCVTSVNTASWVLSPISARKSIPKAMKNNFIKLIYNFTPVKNFYVT